MNIFKPNELVFLPHFTYILLERNYLMNIFKPNEKE